MPNKQISPEISSLFSIAKKPKFLSAVSDQILYTDDILSEPTPLLCPKTVFNLAYGKGVYWWKLHWALYIFHLYV